MALDPRLFQNITGTVSLGYRDYQKLGVFSEHYNCRTQMTGEHVIHRTAHPMTLGVHNAIPPSYEETSEKIIAIHLPESKFHELVYRSNTDLEEQKLRNENPELEKLYHQYKMMVQLYK